MHDEGVNGVEGARLTDEERRNHSAAEFPEGQLSSGCCSDLLSNRWSISQLHNSSACPHKDQSTNRININEDTKDLKIT